MPTCDLCGKEVTLEDYCKVGVMPNPTQPKGWFLSASKLDEKEQIADSNPSANNISQRLGETFAKQTEVRETKTGLGGPKNQPGLFVSIHGKLYFCKDCVAANGGKISKTGVAFVRGKAKKRGKGWWPF